MKKIILTALIVVSCAFSSLTALSWSGVVDNNSKFTANNDFTQIALNQSNGIYLSLASKLNESGSLRFVTEGLFKFNPVIPFKGGSTQIKFIADVDLLKLTGDWVIGDGTVSMALGRFQYSDFSGVVFSQVSDGVYLTYNTLKTKTSLYAGYTGLLNRLNVSMAENSADAANFYALCPGYVPVIADFSYKALFESNTIGLQAAAFIPVTDKNVLKFYGTLILNGYIGTIGTYDVRFTFGTEKFTNAMLNGKLDVNFFIGNSAMATIGAEYASGDQGAIKTFRTLTARSFGTAPFASGVIVPKLAVMYASGNFYGSLTERFIIAMPADKASFDGFDTAATVTYKLLSDVAIGCDIGAYISIANKPASNYYATIKASLAF